MAGNGGGFTNNFISLKTLVERLQYGRDQLVKFWEKELNIVRKAMGFRKPAHIVFDQMSLSDESSEKNLLIQLADRDIISHETILERFKEIPSVEKMRLKREGKDRDKEVYPNKVGPFHKPEMEEFQPDSNKETTPEGGRPPFKKDEEPRKKRVDTPKSKPGLADVVVWASESFEEISSTVNKAYLSINKKSNMRQLTKAQILEVETLKLHILTNLNLLQPVNAQLITDIVSSDKQMPLNFKKLVVNNKISPSNMAMEDYKKRIVGMYVEYFYDTK